MAIKLHSEPKLHEPVLVCAWPGIGKIGIVAVDYLRRAISAEEIGEVEPWDFFEPHKAVVHDGLLKHLEFPSSKFYSGTVAGKDLLLFVGEEQPTEGAGMYATGEKANRMANLVLDVAEQLGCTRVYTSGAAIAQTHHTLKPRVWAVPNSRDLMTEVKDYRNSVLMSEVEGRHGQGAITGLNGLLLGVAGTRGIGGVCLMGEIPYYLQAFPWPYPQASVSVLETLCEALGIDIDLIPLEEMAKKADDGIEVFLENIYKAETIPEELRNELKENIERMRLIGQRAGPVTEEDRKRIMERIDDLFKRGGRGDERAS
jgi:uncharacterized protein